jgi:2-methylcitrate dehydratase PrpD
LSAPTDAADHLIDHALSLRWDGLTGVTRRAALAFLLDTLAVGAAGRNAAHAEGVLAMAQGWGEGGAAGVLGRPGTKLPADSAAFVNAYQIHGQEFDCVHEAAVLHPMSAVLAALLAEMDRGEPVDGPSLLTAIVAGVDVAVTLGTAAISSPKFFRPAIAGIFGSFAAITRLRQMPRGQALDAFGHALAFASGTMQAHVEGKPALPVQVANAARNSLAAIDLARSGMPGVMAPIEGPFGYFAMLENEAELAPTLALLGQGHRIEEVSWKPWPTGRAGQGGIMAVQSLMREHGLSPEHVSTLEYRAPPLITRLVGRPAFAGMAPGYARLCLPYLAAVTLLRGQLGLSDFGEKMLSDPQVLALAAKITVLADDNPDQAAFVPAVVTVHTIDGRRLRKEVTRVFGSPQWPLTRAEQLAKARDCLNYAGLDHCLEPLSETVAAMPIAPDAAAALRRTGVIG